MGPLGSWELKIVARLRFQAREHGMPAWKLYPRRHSPLAQSDGLQQNTRLRRSYAALGRAFHCVFHPHTAVPR